MSINLENNPLLVCPRPVRLAQFAQRLSIDKAVVDEPVSVSVPASLTRSDSPRRCSPRSNEAMDEFLSILKPSLPAFFPPSSPILKFERSRSFKLSRFELEEDEPDSDPVRPASEVEDEHASPTTHMMSMAADLTGRWLRTALISSPISRTNGARNPFTKVVNNRVNPPQSPAAIPLPPTPEP